MSEKSIVSLEQHVCLVCGAYHDTGAILLDRRLRHSLEPKTTTGWGLCPEHRKLYEDGYIAVVECDPTQSGNPAPGTAVDPGSVFRTGRIAHIRRKAFTRVFNVILRADVPCVFAEPAVLEHLEQLSKN